MEKSWSFRKKEKKNVCNKMGGEDGCKGCVEAVIICNCCLCCADFMERKSVNGHGKNMEFYFMISVGTMSLVCFHCVCMHVRMYVC